MSNNTLLTPLSKSRAIELADMMQQVQSDPSKGIALDDDGQVTGVVDVESALDDHVLGDFDVHA